jgi:hypothetical protein
MVSELTTEIMENYTAQLSNSYTATKTNQNIKASLVTKVVFGTMALFMTYHTLISITGIFN